MATKAWADRAVLIPPVYLSLLLRVAKRLPMCLARHMRDSWVAVCLVLRCTVKHPGMHSAY